MLCGAHSFHILDNVHFFGPCLKRSLSLASDLGEPETLGALLDGFQQIVSQLVVGLKKKPLQLQKIQYVLWMRDIFVQIRLRIRTSDQ